MAHRLVHIYGGVHILTFVVVHHGTNDEQKADCTGKVLVDVTLHDVRTEAKFVSLRPSAGTIRFAVAVAVHYDGDSGRGMFMLASMHNYTRFQF